MAAAGEDARIAWANRMRLLLSPKTSVNDDGSLRQDFFKPKKVVFVVDKKWGDAERDKLYEGLEKYGVGGWRDIRSALLPDWDETALRVKASRLFGSQSLARYAGWKVPRGAVEAEYARNKRIGDRTGCWKAGVLVEDDHGTVAKALEEEADLGGPSGAAAGGHAQAGDEAAGAAPAAKKARGAKKA